MIRCSAGQRALAISLGISALTLVGSAGSAQAQAVYWWGPGAYAYSYSYNYAPPYPVYRPAPYFEAERAYGARPELLSPPQLRRSLGARGFELMGPPRRNGGVFVADVRDRAGNERRLILEGHSGRVLQSFPGSASRFGAVPGNPRLAARPQSPQLDSVIPAPPPARLTTPGEQRPGSKKATPPVKKPAIAARPPAAPASQARPQLAPPAAALPQAAPQAAPPAAAIAPPPAIESAPQILNAPPAADAVEAPPAAAPAANAPDRPRRRVRFVKPGAPAQSPESTPGAALVQPPEPPVILPQINLPQRAAAPAPAPVDGGNSAPVPVAPLE